MTVTLRPLEKSDFVTLHRWLNTPHLKPFYIPDPISFSAVINKFSPRVSEGDKVRCVIALSDNRRFGYMQWYHNRSFPDYGAATIGRMAGVSIDYFIGDTNFLGRKLGSEMLNALVEQTVPVLGAEDRIFHIAHDDENLAAIRCSKRAGFVAEEAYVENKRPSTLYVKSAEGRCR